MFVMFFYDVLCWRLKGYINENWFKINYCFVDKKKNDSYVIWVKVMIYDFLLISLK